ncbi:MAG: phosphoribosyltransferase family protein [Methylophilaceae bacterium]|nr:phosphoribosyltransferase family protein [Methylophilaceae bacterium]
MQHNFDRIIPMPLHPKRLAERGFNQSLEIAKLVAKELGIPLDTTSCSRIKFSPPQASLPLKARIKNMRGAFSCHQDLQAQRVILLDDVMTTGASLHELAATVKSAGASHVECWVVARTLAK